MLWVCVFLCWLCLKVMLVLIWKCLWLMIFGDLEKFGWLVVSVLLVWVVFGSRVRVRVRFVILCCFFMLFVFVFVSLGRMVLMWVLLVIRCWMNC